ncbi:MAG TPA: glycosyltransferase, partial [Candidatus Paceibacterota bacterium]|nr:glycosyltransferase [Candidatus Paceibacterota bacterium]
MKNIANNAIITITMDSVISILFYVFSFLAIYIQVFFLVTYIEKRKTIIKNPDKLKLKFYPTVTVAVPCYNEEGTITKTVNSLLNLDYPKSKLRLFLIDDGSKDNTWNIIKEFHNGKNIFAFTKENG